MEITKKEFSFKSASGLADIHGVAYIPDDVKYIIQIAHGMAEHIERYEAFATRLCQNGFAVYTNDHIGHGKSVSSDDELGYFGAKDGWKNFVEDCHQVLELAKKEQGDSLPYIFFGHSMGSFVARAFSLKYADEITGAIYCGTAGPNPAAAMGIMVANLIAKVKGDHYRSKFIDGLAFGAYNKKTAGRTPFDWLTNDEDIVDKYIADKYCGFMFTAYGYRDMFTLLNHVSSKEWFSGLSKELPVLFIAGAEDPVGAYSKGIFQVFDGLKAAGKSPDTMQMHIYPNGRHEILNESKLFDTVCSDIINWVAEITK